MAQHAFIGGKPPKRQNAYKQVAGAIREQVLSGRLQDGEQLPPERDLAAQFGVSRVVVREAIRTLEQAGILCVKKGSGGGTFVCRDFDKPLGETINNLLAGGEITLGDLFELRLMLEPPSAALAAKNGGPLVRGLTEILAESERVKHDPVKLRAANLEFHRRLVACSENPLLSVLCETVLSILVRSVRGKIDGKASLMVLGFHRRIMAAIQAGDPDEARRLTEADLAQLRESYLNLGVTVPSGEEEPVRADGWAPSRAGSA